MDMRPVASSNIKAVGYDHTARTLHVDFGDSGVYTYDGVDPDQHMALMNAESVGKHFHAHIKGKHQHRKLGAENEQAKG